MKKMQFDPKNGMPKYHMKPAGKTEWNHMLDACVEDDILVLDFYEKVKNRWQAMWRTLLSEKDYANYDYMEKAWNTRYIAIQQEEYKKYTADTTVTGSMEWEKYFLVKGKSRTVIEKYVRSRGGFIYTSLGDTVFLYEKCLKEEQRETAAERKLIRIQKKMAELPDVPPGFRETIMETTFKNDHILYFGKDGAYCSRCGRRVKAEGKKHGETGECPECRKRVVFKDTRYIKEHAEDKEVLYIQPYGEETVLRYFKCALVSACKRKERLVYTESVRTYHGNKISVYKKRYIHYYSYNGEFWTDRMNAFHPVAYGNSTCLYTGNMEEIRGILGNIACYALEQTGNEGQKVHIKDILNEYNTDQLQLYEKLYKAGLKRLAGESMKRTNGISWRRNQRELKKTLKISKPMLEYMVKTNGGRKTLEILQDAFADPRGLNDEKIFRLAKAGIKAGELAETSEKNKLMKTLNYLEREAGYKNLNTTFTHYRDYIGMAEAMGYDMSNGTVRYPKDLRQAHDRAVAMFYDGETDKMKREALKKYPNIKRMKTGLEERYAYRTKKYLITAPHSAADIIEEGRSLHHCVGGDTYLDRHNRGKSYILFMRKTEEPDKSYYTIEIDPETDTIRQYYGMNDKKPDREAVDAFLKKWKAHMAQKKKAATERPQKAAG